MILSDGGTENPKKILEVYTNSSRGMTANSRIFTYAVGPHPLPTVALKVELVSKESKKKKLLLFFKKKKEILLHF